MKYFIRTFGCQQNVADSQRIASYYEARGFSCAKEESKADLIVINSCMIRDKAEERVYGYIRNLNKKYRPAKPDLRIVLTGCIVGASVREPSGKMKKKIEKRIPDVELLSIDEVGFEYEPQREKNDAKHGWVIISNGCNNYCAFCIVPFARGKEISRPYEGIVDEVRKMVADGYESITLLGQNVNSYGADLVMGSKQNSSVSSRKVHSDGNIRDLTVSNNGDQKKKKYIPKHILSNGRKIDPVMVEHLGRARIPTLFPHLLEDVAQIPGIKTVTFTSSNPWDFSDELIDVIARNKNIDRLLHLPVQSGSTEILKKMNRWYTKEQFVTLLQKIRSIIPEVQFITDIIVGFPGETEEDFEETIDLVKQAGFVRAFIACYSSRPGTEAAGNMDDAIPWEEKKRRYRILNEMINKKNRGVSESKDWIRTSDQA